MNDEQQAAKKILDWCDKMNAYLAELDKAEFFNDDGIIQLPNGDFVKRP